MKPAQPRHPIQDVAYRTALAKLRFMAAEEERGLSGYQAIADYLNEKGIKNGRGGPIKVSTVKTWIRGRGFPHWVMKKCDGVWSSNLMILAWLWTYVEYRRARTVTKPRNWSITLEHWGLGDIAVD